MRSKASSEWCLPCLTEWHTTQLKIPRLEAKYLPKLSILKTQRVIISEPTVEFLFYDTYNKFENLPDATSVHAQQGQISKYIHVYIHMNTYVIYVVFTKQRKN